MRKWMWLLLIILTLVFSPPLFAAEKAIVLDISGPIGPATQDYVERGIAYAQTEHAEMIILQLNTPGGLDTSMRGINAAIINSPIPIITYVAPAGSRAGSAGAYILYASHLAVMAPGTNVGAATPINITGANKTDVANQSAEEQKAVKDASAYIRSLAQLRGRNAAWAEQAVTKAESLSANEAKNLNVINEIAENDTQLLQKIDGKSVSVQGNSKILHTKNLSLEKLSPDWRYQFLAFLTNPNIAYILMLIAIYGLFFELSNPGLILPGVVGVISLLLVLYAFQLMPINYVGLTLMLIGIGFMIFEVYVSSFGVIGVGGVVAFIIGSIMLFDMQDANYHLNWSLILAMSVFSIGFFFLILTLVFRSHKKAIITGQEGLIGSTGIVLSIMNEQVIVRVQGEIWEARSLHQLNSGQKIKVTSIHGLVLEVEPFSNKA